VTISSVGGFFVSSGIDHLNQSDVVLFFLNQ
jgi:hypothetical protein